MQWDIVDITEAVFDALAGQFQADSDAQAVYSLDSKDELGLHPYLQTALSNQGYGVHPEQCYPAESKRKRKSEGRRCDIVLTQNAAPLLDPNAKQTLFMPDNAVSTEEAYWLEIKTVSQFTLEGPFSRYSSELLGVVSKDIKKLASDHLIFHGGIMLVLFTANEQIAEHDLQIWLQRCHEKAMPVGMPILRGCAIPDRMGNAWMTVAHYPVSRLQEA